ncbi:hypothetical protein CEK29_10090 [Bordetella genomosp. 5]|uniref:Lipoprotein n=1 Tax=Bordetella genomosp. 5 TaxID=1395608 RepID=A0A261TTY7_9BORD|nr:hypothetical protein [Bordetella genomosp. 5]OZI43497.1 hypothetical protein CEK29_10090 [Bordetella genomosp. 5]OZI52741.1 hypothetical protein CAL25_08315 [Bordetella genomosp. 5]
MRVVKHLMSWTVAIGLLAGCAATGHNFDPGKLSTLTPGQSTLPDAARALNAQPATVYARRDGSALVLWQHKITFVTDGLYSRKEAWLEFGPDGRLVRLVDSTNILLEPWERQKLLGPPPPAPIVIEQTAQPEVEVITITVPPPARTR